MIEEGRFVVTAIIVAVVLSVLGGLVGTWFSIHRAQGNHERRSMIRLGVFVWGFTFFFIPGLLLVPPPWNGLLWIPYALALCLAVRACHRVHHDPHQKSGTLHIPGH